MAPIVRIFAVIFAIMTLIYIFPSNGETFESTYILLMFTQLFIILGALYFFTFGFENLRTKLSKSKSTEPYYIDYITIFGSFAFITVVFFLTGGNESLYKILFLPTILFYTVRFGLKWGFAASGMTAFTLTAANVIAFMQQDVYKRQFNESSSIGSFSAQ